MTVECPNFAEIFEMTCVFAISSHGHVTDLLRYVFSYDTQANVCTKGKAENVKSVLLIRKSAFCQKVTVHKHKKSHFKDLVRN